MHLVPLTSLNVKCLLFQVKNHWIILCPVESNSFYTNVGVSLQFLVFVVKFLSQELISGSVRIHINLMVYQILISPGAPGAHLYPCISCYFYSFYFLTISIRSYIPSPHPCYALRSQCSASNFCIRNQLPQASLPTFTNYRILGHLSIGNNTFLWYRQSR